MAVTDTIADYVEASLHGCQPGALISRERLDRIGGVAAMLPGALTEFFGFECPLGTDEPVADFLVCVGAVEGGRSVLAGANSHAPLPAGFDEHWCWQRVLAFAREWNDSLSPFHDAITGMWLEFDMDAEASPVPLPSVFIGSDRLRRDPARSNDVEQFPRHCSWFKSVMPLLNGTDVSGDRLRTIARCVNALPSSAYIFQVGWMLSRPTAPTRICVRGASPAEVLEYLRTIGWKDALDEIATQLDILSGYVLRIDLDLDVDGCVAPKIGLECYLSTTPDAVPRFVDWLAATGYSTRDKAGALQNWTGMAHEKLSRRHWPSGLLAASSFLNGRFHSAFVRWLHHVKIVYQPGQPAHAKAYLGVRHVWLDPIVIKTALKPTWV